jgi:hypothetical protein
MTRHINENWSAACYTSPSATGTRIAASIGVVLTFLTNQAITGFAERRGGHPRLIVHGITRFATSLVGARQRSAVCAKLKNSLALSEADARDRVLDLPSNFWSVSSKRYGVLRDKYVHVLFRCDVMRRHRSRPTAGIAGANAEIAPSPERQNHGLIERVERPIADDTGRPSRPYRAVDTLAAMERRGSITSAMRQAGQDFRVRFATAQLDPLSAFDISRPRTGHLSNFGSREALSLRIENAREVVWRAILAVGGLNSAGGSCLWHVVGWERSLKEWALEQGWSGRRVSQEAASGILIAALGALEAHLARSQNC